MRSVEHETSWVFEAVRRRESDLGDACASAAVHVSDPIVAGRLAELAFEHLHHARPRCDCTRPCAPEVDAATLRARAHRACAFPDFPLKKAVDAAISGAVARAHAELALFIDDACASLLIAPFERERLLRVAFCSAALGESIALR